MLYRMEPKKYRKEAFPEQEKLRLYEEYGWKYAATFGEYFHIYTTYFCGFLAAISFLLVFYPEFRDYSDRPMAKINHPLPFVPLAEIENDPDFVPSKSYIQHDRLQNGEYVNSWERDAETVYFQSCIGAPVQFSINQHGIMKDKTNEKASPYQATLWLSYKKFSFLVSPWEYLEEYIAHHREAYNFYLPKDGWTETVLTDTPFDYALLLQNGRETELYMILGNKMLEADYTGKQDLTQYYSLFLEILRQEYHR